MTNKLAYLQTKLGLAVSWLTLLLVLMTFAVVVLRYAFNLGWVAMQESLTYIHVLIFMGGMAYTLQQDEHVRVDIFYHKLSTKKQAWVDVIGSVISLLPICAMIGWLSWEYVTSAWAIKESSIESAGIPYLYLLKTVIPVMAFLLAVQGGLMIHKKVAIILEKNTA